MKPIVLIGLAVVLTLEAQALATEPRVKLYRFDDFVVADWTRGVVPESRRYNPTTRELEFTVDLLIRNSSRDRRMPLTIRGAQYVSDKETFGVECRDLNRSIENLSLKPGAYTRLDCIVRLVATDRNAIASAGAKGYIKIPFDGADRDKSIRIPYEVDAAAFSATAGARAERIQTPGELKDWILDDVGATARLDQGCDVAVLYELLGNHRLNTFRTTLQSVGTKTISFDPARSSVLFGNGREFEFDFVDDADPIALAPGQSVVVDLPLEAKDAFREQDALELHLPFDGGCMIKSQSLRDASAAAFRQTSSKVWSLIDLSAEYVDGAAASVYIRHVRNGVFAHYRVDDEAAAFGFSARMYVGGPVELEFDAGPGRLAGDWGAFGRLILDWEFARTRNRFMDWDHAIGAGIEALWRPGGRQDSALVVRYRVGG